MTDPQRFHEEQQRIYQEYAQAYSHFFRDCMPDTGVPARFTVHVVDFPDKAASYEFYSVGPVSAGPARSLSHADF